MFHRHTPSESVTRLGPLPWLGLHAELGSVTGSIQAVGEHPVISEREFCRQRSAGMCLSFFCVLKPTAGSEDEGVTQLSVDWMEGCHG